MNSLRRNAASAAFAALAIALAASASGATVAIQYRIDARVGVSDGVVSARETIAWSNGTNEPRQIAVCAAPEHHIVGDAGLRARTVAPGELVTLDLQWTATLSRAGRSDVIAEHWYPRMAVAGDGGPARCLPTASGSTAPDDPADFDVSLSVPPGWIVAATGREQTAEDGGASGITHRFQQRGVREFVWLSGQYYVERTRRIGVAPRAVDVRLLIQPEHLAQVDHLLDAAAEALAQHARWLTPYPDDHLTIVDTGWRSATDRSYPRLITFGTRWIVTPTDLTPEAAIVRGVSGQWWGGVVGLDPVEDHALGDGLRDYFTWLSVERLFDLRQQRLATSTFGRAYFGGFIPWTSPNVRVPRASAYRTRGGRGLGTLERYLGAPTFQRALAAVVDRYQDQRISRAEFFRALGDAAGQDLAWFESAVFAQSGSFDYAVASVMSVPDDACGASRCFRTTVVVERRGDGQFTGTSKLPVGPYSAGRALVVTVAFADGQRADDTWDGRGPVKSIVFRSHAPAVSAFVDPGRTLLLDGKQTNNSWTSAPRAGFASTRWAATWAIWLQDLLRSYASLL